MLDLTIIEPEYLDVRVPHDGKPVTVQLPVPELGWWTDLISSDQDVDKQIVKVLNSNVNGVQFSSKDALTLTVSQSNALTQGYTDWVLGLRESKN